MRLEFMVHGTPQPQGSARAFVPKGWKRAVITTDNKSLKPWRQEVSGMAHTVMQATGQAMEAGAVRVSVVFCFARPKSVRSMHKTTKPDVDKLLRGVFDALSGIAFKDDSQVVKTEGEKRFELPEGARITVESI